MFLKLINKWLHREDSSLKKYCGEHGIQAILRWVNDLKIVRDTKTRFLKVSCDVNSYMSGSVFMADIISLFYVLTFVTGITLIYKNLFAKDKSIIAVAVEIVVGLGKLCGFVYVLKEYTHTSKVAYYIGYKIPPTLCFIIMFLVIFSDAFIFSETFRKFKYRNKILNFQLVLLAIPFCFRFRNIVTFVI